MGINFTSEIDKKKIKRLKNQKKKTKKVKVKNETDLINLAIL